MRKEDIAFCLERGIIDIPDIQSIIEMEKHKKLIENHPYKPWQGKNGNWYVYLPDEKKGRILKKRATKEGIEDVICDYQLTLIENPTLEEIFNEWNDRRRDLKKITKSSHSRMRQTFKRHFQEFGKKRIRNISELEIIEFLEEQIPKYHLTSRSFGSLKTIMRGILKRAKRQGYIYWSPESMFADLDVSDKQFFKSYKEDDEQVFDEEEMNRVIEYLKTNCDIKNAGILLLFISGMRIGELVALKHEDLDPEENTVKIRRTEIRYCNDNNITVYEVQNYPKTKSGLREIVIPSSYQWLIRNLYYSSNNNEYVFVENGERLMTYHLRRREYAICRKLKIRKKSPHKIRATYDSILLDSNVDNRTIKDQMGHAEIRTSEIHYHRNRKSINRKREIIDSIAEFA